MDWSRPQPDVLLGDDVIHPLLRICVWGRGQDCLVEKD